MPQGVTGRLRPSTTYAPTGGLPIPSGKQSPQFAPGRGRLSEEVTRKGDREQRACGASGLLKRTTIPSWSMDFQYPTPGRG